MTKQTSGSRGERTVDDLPSRQECEVKGICMTCRKKPGLKCVDNGLAAGTHCEACWNKLVADCRSRSW